MYSIGEVSKITGLTVKTLRFYHEQGVLSPSCIDDQSGYRYYDQDKIETARVVAHLRRLEFSLQDIARILQDYEDEGDILVFVERQKEAIAAKMKHFRSVVKSLDQILSNEKEARRIMQETTHEIEEKTVEPTIVAGARMKGRYSDCGQGFARIGRQFGRRICGKPMLLIYDSEYKEEDADFEACMPVRGGRGKEGVSVRELPGGRCISLMHKGPYQELGRTYEKLLAYVKARDWDIESPCREVYLKGPGMIFKGNPKNYLTEVQLMLKN